MEALRQAVGEHPAAALTVTRQTPGWPVNDASASLLEAFRRAGGALGLSVEPEHRAGLSDGNFLWPHAPTIDGLGPSGGCVHCSQRGEDGRGQEYAVKSTFARKAALTALALAELAGA
jgi:hypothetical protein